MATISDVAKKAGVAISTVSKVLKNYDHVSADTKKKVLDAVNELNYVPNSMASALSSKTHNKIAIYMYINDNHQAIDEINMSYLQAAFEKTTELHLNTITIFNNTSFSYTTEGFIQYLTSQGVGGLVVYGLNKEDTLIHELIEKEVFKIVVVDAPLYNKSTTSVFVDHSKGQYKVAKALIHPATKHVLYIAGKKNGYVTDQRIEGIQLLQKEYQFNLNIQYGEFSEKKAFDLVRKYGDKNDAIVCASDLMAIGALHALSTMNIFRPVCGYDGISLMGYAGKNTLTCSQDFKETSMRAIEEIHDLLNGGEGKQVILGFKVTMIKYEDVIF